jgi:bacterioferritin-associated ferredoxin
MQPEDCDCCSSNQRYEKSTKPVTICYCNQITDRKIIKTVHEKGLKTIDEIKHHLRSKVISNCANLNPTGKCCHQQFQAVIDEASSST